MAMLAALMQSPLAALAPGVSGLEMIDDIFVILMVIACIPKLGRAPGMVVMLILGWGLLMVGAVLQSTVSFSDSFILFRQVTIPTLLIVVGLTLTKYQWAAIRKLAIWVGIANLVYMALEIVGIRLLDASKLTTFNDGRGQVRDGLPSYYFYWVDPDSLFAFSGEPYIARLGGLLLNPPVAGLALAAAIVFLWFDRSFRFRKILLVAMSIAILLTFSRGGWLVVLFALVLPFLLRKIKRVGAVLVMAPALWFMGTQMAEHGNSESHTDGLTEGLSMAFTHPLGMGFGQVGNYLKSLNITKISESLLGIAFSAAGLAAVLLVVLLALKLWNTVGRRPWIWEAALGMGIISAALLSETAGALNATIPLWLAIGVALRLDYDVRKGRIAKPGAVQV